MGNNNKFEAVNWNRVDDKVKLFWDQNVKQFWVDEEIDLSQDVKDWTKLSDIEKETYEQILAGLTLLDTFYGSVGLPKIIDFTEDLHVKAVLSFQQAMEQMHAKSYSTIFSTLSKMARIDELFEWVNTNLEMQTKLNKVFDKYVGAKEDEDIAIVYATSAFLEAFVFFSGFFYPLWFAGHGKLVGSGEIINLIIRDETIHAKFDGYMFRLSYDKLTDEKKAYVDKEVMQIFKELYEIELEYTDQIYTNVGLVDEVVKFIQFNGNNAFEFLGYPKYFDIEESDVNPIIINGINTETKTHDFFSTKGNGYIKPTQKSEALTDDDFDF